jgi:hypothetical protein
MACFSNEIRGYLSVLLLHIFQRVFPGSRFVNDVKYTAYSQCLFSWSVKSYCQIWRQRCECLSVGLSWTELKEWLTISYKEDESKTPNRHKWNLSLHGELISSKSDTNIFGIATCSGLDSQGIGFWVPVWGQDFYPLHVIQTVSGARGFFPVGKAREQWNWPHLQVVPRSKKPGTNIHSPPYAFMA